MTFRPKKAILDGDTKSIFVIAMWLKRNPSTTLTMNAYGDKITSDSYNKKLTLDRCKVVTRALLDFGVLKNRITGCNTNYGEESDYFNIVYMYVH